MSESELEGYHGQVLNHLRKSGARIGSILRVTSKSGEAFEGLLIPRSEYSDQNHICLKMKNGYNIGIHLQRTEKLEVLGTGEKPRFSKPPPTPRHTDLPTVSIISTGGTIASRVDYRTGAVEPALSAEELSSIVPELSSLAQIDARILYSVYSENVTPSHWTGMVEEVAKRIVAGADGVIITHGTDTMHYTSAALSFALQTPPVPVLLVGAQRSSDRPSSDAASNLVGSVAMAAKGDFAGVGVVMHKDYSDRTIIAHKGTRVRKCHTSRRDTFRSINSSPLAEYDLQTGRTTVLDTPLRRDMSRRLTLKPHFDKHAYLFKFHPGFNPHLIDNSVESGAKGIILEGTGLGHVGSYSYHSVKKAVKQDVPVFMTSQTIWGRVQMNVYYTGRDLLKIGVTPLEDMISETAIVKLMWVLAQTKSPDKVRELMVTPLVGEITARTFAEAA